MLVRIPDVKGNINLVLRLPLAPETTQAKKQQLAILEHVKSASSDGNQHLTLTNHNQAASTSYLMDLFMRTWLKQNFPI